MQERTGGRPYLHRVLDDELDQKSAEFAAISIEGPKGIGKTETAQRRAHTDYRLDGPAGEVVAANPQVVLTGEPPILIDEWVRVPATWDVIRRAVDDGAPPGSYLPAGSASEHGSHTGAGRILTLRMRPLTLSERGIEAPTVSIRQLLGGERPAVSRVKRASGWRTTRMRSPASGSPRAARSTRVATSSATATSSPSWKVPTPGNGPPLSAASEVLPQWMNAYAAATASTASLEDNHRNAATRGQGKGPRRPRPSPTGRFCNGCLSSMSCPRGC